MYILPLPELKIIDTARNDMLNRASSLTKSDWYFRSPSASVESGKCTRGWYDILKGDPIFEMFVDQFMIPDEEFYKGNIKMQFYELLPLSNLRSHKDNGRTALLTINLKNLDSTRLYFYQRMGSNAEPTLSLKLPVIPYLIDGQEYHGARNGSRSPRIALTLSFFDPYTFDMLEKMYKDRVLLKCQQQDEYRFPGGREHWVNGPVLVE